MSGKIRVLIIDDSALVRQLLTEILNTDDHIEVVGVAADPFFAREKIKKLNPDVLTLDVEMPKMDGLTFLGNLMRLRPMPVVMVSSLTEEGADTTLRALELGAVDFVSKPKTDFQHTIDDYANELIEKVKTAAGARVRALEPEAGRPRGRERAALDIAPKLSADAVLKKIAQRKHFKTSEQIIALGASTGGTEAIRQIIRALPADAPGLVVSQHIPPAFSAPFARRVNQESSMNVCEAVDGQQILPGHAYIAPGDRHLLVARDGARYVIRLSEGPPVNRHRPSVDVMFRSIAQNVGQNAVGIILTGMGGDGAQGLKEMHDAGAATLAQDKKTSVVWGMPGEAVRLGAVDKVLPLDKMCTNILALAKKK